MINQSEYEHTHAREHSETEGVPARAVDYCCPWQAIPPSLFSLNTQKFWSALPQHFNQYWRK